MNFLIGSSARVRFQDVWGRPLLSSLEELDKEKKKMTGLLICYNDPSYSNHDHTQRKMRDLVQFLLSAHDFYYWRFVLPALEPATSKSRYH